MFTRDRHPSSTRLGTSSVLLPALVTGAVLAPMAPALAQTPCPNAVGSGTYVCSQVGQNTVGVPIIGGHQVDILRPTVVGPYYVFPGATVPGFSQVVDPGSVSVPVPGVCYAVDCTKPTTIDVPVPPQTVTVPTIVAPPINVPETDVLPGLSTTVPSSIDNLPWVDVWICPFPAHGLPVTTRC